MFNILVLLIIAGCVAYQFLKGSLLKAFATIIITICAGAVAFGYFEALADLIISRSNDGKASAIVPWAQTLSFGILFILAFAILQTIAAYLTRQNVDLGFLPERIGRVVCGIFLGLLLSGVVLTALAMAPLPNKYPYQRFDERNPDAERPGKALLNPDGFATGWFSMLSNGSFSAIRNKRSFAALHPEFLDQLFLNRHSASDKILTITALKDIELPPANQMPSWWLAYDNTKDQDGNTLRKSGHDIAIARVGIKKRAIKQAGTFTLSQLRLICKQNGFKNPFTGKAKNIYPIGYMTAQNRIQTKKLNETIQILNSDVTGSVKWIDFAFYVPNGFMPALVEFKLNSIVEIKTRTAAEPPPDIKSIEKGTEPVERDESSEPRIYKPPGY